MTINSIKITLLLIILFSCGQKEEGAIPLSEILPESERYRDGMDTANPIDVKDTLDELKLSLRKCAFQFDQIVVLEEKILPDRFNPIKQWKLGLVGPNDTVKYYRWDYKDSLQTMNVFFNWIDCFSKNCISAYVGEEINFQKNTMQILVNNNSIIFIEAKEKLNFDLWIACHESLGIDQKWNYIIEQRQRSKAKWYKFTDDQKTKIQTTTP